MKHAPSVHRPPYGWWAGSVLALVAVWSWWESGTRTFSLPAELASGLAVGLLLVLSAWRWVAAHGWLPDMPHAIRELLDPEVLDPKPLGQGVSVPRRAAWAWGAVVAVVLSVELVELFQGPRSVHPTISVFGNALLRSARVVHGLVFAAWLLTGLWLCVQGDLPVASPVQDGRVSEAGGSGAGAGEAGGMEARAHQAGAGEAGGMEP